MDIHEIAIGNIVKFKNDIVSIFSISFDGALVVQTNDNDIIECSIDELSGMEIDMILLEKTFDATYDANALSWSINLSNCSIELSSETSNTIERKWGLSVFDKEDECVLIADVQYVHQLQNLLYTSVKEIF
jgi:hypothetical protein